jgi:hypothetical protein
MIVYGRLLVKAADAVFQTGPNVIKFFTAVIYEFSL